MSFGGRDNEKYFASLLQRNIMGLGRRNNELHELHGAKHCSSLCSQSEGHGHVARMLKSAIGSL